MPMLSIASVRRVVQPALRSWSRRTRGNVDLSSIISTMIIRVLSSIQKRGGRKPGPRKPPRYITLKRRSQPCNEGELAVSTPSRKQDESGRQSYDSEKGGESNFDIRDLKPRCKRYESNKGRAEDEACRWSHYEKEGIRILWNEEFLERKLDQVRKHLQNSSSRARIERADTELDPSRQFAL